MKSVLLVKKFLGLVNSSFSWPEWQAVKMILFAPCGSLTQGDFLAGQVTFKTYLSKNQNH